LKPRLLILSICCLAFYTNAYADWSEDIRLTDRRYEILPKVIARNDTVHVAWNQVAMDDFVSYIRSTNGGVNWDSLANLTAYGHQGFHISLSLAQERVFVDWRDLNFNGPNPLWNIAFSACLGGGNWGIPRYVYPDTLRDHRSYDLGTAIHFDSIFVVYFSEEHDSSGFLQFKFLFSSDLGQTWDGEKTVAHGYNYTNPLQIAKCGNTLFIVWSGDNPPTIFNRRVIGTISRDGGISWTEPFLISSNEHTAQHSCVACDEETGYFAVGWMDYTFSGGFPGDLFVRITTDGGISWGGIQHATSHHGITNPHIDIRGDSIWAVWSDQDSAYGPMNSEICFSKSTDLGFSWTSYERLTYADGWSNTPWISYDSGKLHMVWEDDRDGAEIFYKRFDPEQDAIDNDISLPTSLTLSAYPNPLNSATSITLTGAKQAEIAIYDITGRKICVLNAQNGQAIWDAAAYTSGLYFAVTEINRQSLKITLMR
jgi:hypothetical protein